MTNRSEHLSISIDLPAAVVYDFASDPVHLPAWASGLGDTIDQVNGEWIAQSPMGPIVFAFVERNDFGVLDHFVTTDDGNVFYNPMRVIADGEASEVIFTLRRQPGTSDEEYNSDRAAITTDLAKLKDLLESSRSVGSAARGAAQ